MPGKRTSSNAFDGDGNSLPSAAKKPRAKTVIEKVVHVIRYFKSASGSSMKAITSQLSKAEEEGGFLLQNESVVKKAVKKAVLEGILIQNKASYLVAGDETYPDLSEKVEIEVLKPGKGGDPVKKGSNVVISYKGTLKSNGKSFDSSNSFSFEVCAGDVIKGMDQGVMGMTVGEKRRVTIPSSLGYGKRGSGPEIPPNSDLVFEFALNSVQ